MKNCMWLFAMILCVGVLDVSTTAAETCASASVDVEWQQIICPGAENERVCAKTATFIISITSGCGGGDAYNPGGGQPPIYTGGGGSGSSGGSGSQSGGGSYPGGSPSVISEDDCIYPPPPCEKQCCP